MRTRNNFIELREAWGNFALEQIRREKKKRMVKGHFDIGLLRKINPKKAIAITVVAINTPLPTASLITNPIVYKKIMAFKSDPIKRKINLIKIRLRW